MEVSRVTIVRRYPANCLLLLMSVSRLAISQIVDPKDLLQRATEKIETAADEFPRFACTETLDR